MKVENLVPEIYYKESRDFSFIGRLFEIVFNYIKTTSTLVNTSVLQGDLDSFIIDLVASTLGFEFKHKYVVNDLVAICQSFSLLIKKKGSIQVILDIINILANVQSLNEEEMKTINVSFDENDINKINIQVPTSLNDIILLEDLFEYVLPAGTLYEIKKVDQVYDFGDFATLVTEDGIEVEVKYPYTLSRIAGRDGDYGSLTHVEVIMGQNSVVDDTDLPLDQDGIKYKMNWYDWEGNLLGWTEVPAGYIPNYTDTNPRTETGYHFNFLGWYKYEDGIIDENYKASDHPAQCDMNYIAKYSDPIINTYAISFYRQLKIDSQLLDPILISMQEVPYNTKPIVPPVKPSTAQYIYFDEGGWPTQENIPVATADTVYTQIVEQQNQTYTVIWKDWSNNLPPLQVDNNVPYGTMPEYTGNTPVRPNTSQYEYWFVSWSPTISIVTGDITYTPIFGFRQIGGSGGEVPFGE